MQDQKLKDRLELFKKDLKELLDKHKAGVSFCVSDCSDTHGLSDERMTVSFLLPKSPAEAFHRRSQEFTLVSGRDIDPCDLQD